MKRTLFLGLLTVGAACDSRSFDDVADTTADRASGGIGAVGVGEESGGVGGLPRQGGVTISSGASASAGGVGGLVIGGAVVVGGGGVVAGGGGAMAGGGGAMAGGGGAMAGGGSSNVDPTCRQGEWNGAPPQPLTLSGNTFAHDPSMVKVGDTYLRYWTGDYIPSATSKDLVNWSNTSPVYPGGYPDWVQKWQASIDGETFNFPWAPDVSFFGGSYHVYSSFSAIFGDNISCITHLSSSDPVSGLWVDHGPVFCTDGSESFNAIDADVGLDEEGTPWLSFGSFWDGIFIFQLTQEGSREGDEVARLAWAEQIEAPVLFYRCGYYYLFVTWGICCPGEGRSVEDLSYRVVMGRADNILGPYLDREGQSLLEGGGSLLVQGDGDTWAAAGHSDILFDNEKIYHVYHAYRRSDGGAELRIVELPFDQSGWPVPGGP